MFLFTELRYQLFRNFKRSILTFCISIFLVGCAAFYLGNIRSNEVALKGLSEAVPVQVQVMSHNGKSNSNLNIDPYFHDVLISADVKNVKSRAVLAGVLSPEAKAQEMLLGGDTEILAVNDISAAKGVSAENIIFADKWDISFLAGDKLVCLISEIYAESHGLTIGDRITPALYASVFGMVTKYKPIGEYTLEIIGTYAGGSSDFLVPVEWARTAADEYAKGSFYYESLCVELCDPMQLNAFKAQMHEKGFLEPDSESTAANFGDVLSVEDQLFIETAEKLQLNLRVFESFRIPFFLLIVLLTTLTIFLTLRSSAREMAISCSLGSSRLRSFGVYFGSNMLVNLIACGVIFPLILHLTSMPAADMLGVCALYLLCAAIGTALALAFLLRFDILTQLTKAD